MSTATSSRQSAMAGIGHVVALAVMLVVFSAVGFIGYKLYAHPKHNGSDLGTVQSAQPADSLTAADAPAVRTSADLDKAASVLDQVNTAGENSSDSAQLDTQTNAF